MALTKSFWTSKSIAGSALVSLGVFVLYHDISVAISGISHTLNVCGCGSMGVVPAIVLMISKVLRVYTADHHRVLHRFLEGTLLCAWPLGLLHVGSLLSQDARQDRPGAPKRLCAVVDSADRHSTLE